MWGPKVSDIWSFWHLESLTFGRSLWQYSLTFGGTGGSDMEKESLTMLGRVSDTWVLWHLLSVTFEFCDIRSVRHLKSQMSLWSPWQAFWQPIECPGQLGTRSWDQKTQSWMSHSHPSHWVCPEHAVPRCLFSSVFVLWCSQMNFLKTPLSGKLVSAQLLTPPPWKMTPPPSPKTVD